MTPIPGPYSDTESPTDPGLVDAQAEARNAIDDHGHLTYTKQISVPALTWQCRQCRNQVTCPDPRLVNALVTLGERPKWQCPKCGYKASLVFSRILQPARCRR